MCSIPSAMLCYMFLIHFINCNHISHHTFPLVVFAYLGMCRYSHDFLLQLRFSPASCVRPLGLELIPGVTDNTPGTVLEYKKQNSDSFVSICTTRLCHCPNCYRSHCLSSFFAQMLLVINFIITGQLTISFCLDKCSN